MVQTSFAAGVVATALLVAAGPGCAAQQPGASVLAPNALLKTPVGGLPNTRSTAEIVFVTGQSFAHALRVHIGAASAETNATQLTMRTSAAVKLSDAIFASFYVRGAAADGRSPARTEFLFERCVSPWTKSIAQGIVTPRKAEVWKRVPLAFLAAEDYSPGEAMVSLPFASGPQTVEVGGLEITDAGPGMSPDDVADTVACGNPLGKVKAALQLSRTRQTMVAFGGDFCQPRCRRTEALDAVGRYNLNHLHVAHALIGIPLNWWAPEPEATCDEAQAPASFLAMQELTQRKIPIAASIWEGPLIATLRSSASLKAKADACIDLARVGTRHAVPALTPLLRNADLSDMARYALEPIPDPSADAALRNALPGARGRLLIGIISSLGARRDPRAVDALVRRLRDPDPEVAQAAARALGSIGNAAALSALRSALPTARPGDRPALCEGLFRCAEKRNGASAAAIYDSLRAMPGLPANVRLAALWNAIRCRGAAGLPLLIQTIRSQPLLPAAGAMRLATNLPGHKVTRALARLLGQVDLRKQILLVQTLGDRGDAAALGALLPLARKGPAHLRVAAIQAVAQLRGPTALPALVALAKDREASVADAARAGILGFPGPAADRAVIALLEHRDPRIRSAFASVAVQRRIDAARPALLKAAHSADAAVAAAAFRALGELGQLSDMPAVEDALMAGRAIEAGEAALAAICARQKDATVYAGPLLSGLARAHGEPRLALLRLLASAGGPRALEAVRTELGAADSAERETALQTLCAWPTADAIPDLARIAATADDNKSRVLALRGELRLVQLPSVPVERKLALLQEALPKIDRREEQTMALAVLGGIPRLEALTLVTPYLTGEGPTAEASLAAVSIGEKIVGDYPAEVAEALSLIRTDDRELAGRIAALLARVPKDAVDVGFTPIFNGRDLTGWDGSPGWWTVQDGAITSESTPEKPCAAPTYLIWRGGQPADFELRADFKLSVSANSGIQIRSQERPNWDTFGYQADMTGDGALVGFIYHHSRGLIAGRGERAVFAPDGKKTTEQFADPAKLLQHFRQGEWNTYRVVCRGPQISVYLNGVLMCAITDHHATEAATRGIIALQMHPGPPMKVQFKNVRIREFK